MLVELDGTLAQGQGVSPDTMEASGRAYLRAVTNALAKADALRREGDGASEPTPAVVP